MLISRIAKAGEISSNSMLMTGFIEKRRLLLLAVVCLAFRAIVPAGYMPGNLLDGEYMVLCPVGLPAGLAETIHTGHGGHAADVLDADRVCPIGSALQPAWLPTDVTEVQVDRGSQPLFAIDEYLPPAINRIRPYQGRAPPNA